MRATLEIKDAPELGAGGKRFVVDCRHGTTTGDFIPGSVAVSELDTIRWLLVSHDRAEQCRCTEDLWRQQNRASVWTAQTVPTVSPRQRN